MKRVHIHIETIELTNVSVASPRELHAAALEELNALSASNVSLESFALRERRAGTVDLSGNSRELGAAIALAIWSAVQK